MLRCAACCPGLRRSSSPRKSRSAILNLKCLFSFCGWCKEIGHGRGAFPAGAGSSSSSSSRGLVVLVPRRELLKGHLSPNLPRHLRGQRRKDALVDLGGTHAGEIRLSLRRHSRRRSSSSSRGDTRGGGIGIGAPKCVARCLRPLSPLTFLRLLSRLFVGDARCG